MKKLFAILTFFVLIFNVNAQNTFPASGNVGIGTASPQINLEVVGSGQIIRNTSSIGYTTLRLYNNQNAGSRGLELDYSGSGYTSSLLAGGTVGESAAITTTGVYPLLFGTNNTARAILTNTGNFGIGTISPAAKLHVKSDNIRLEGISTVGGNIWDIRCRDIVDNDFGIYSVAQSAYRMYINNSGNVGIGTTAPNSYKLAVAGPIGAWGEVRVFTTGAAFPDYVFDPAYQLPSLEETEKYVKENRHLPEVPSAADIEKDGMSLNGMNTILLKKVEELTLYMIEMKKENEIMKKEIKELKENKAKR
ncbi:MAG: hypothetical protein ACKVOQ_07220 [Cyclobacteriaceae bacterium]